MGLVYLTQMEPFRAEKCASEVYHTWFADGSLWDSNPPPGYVPGGPNKSYKGTISSNTSSRVMIPQRPSTEKGRLIQWRRFTTGDMVDTRNSRGACSERASRSFLRTREAQKRRFSQRAQERDCESNGNAQC